MEDDALLKGSILDALDEPALIVRGQIVEFANRPARELLGELIVGRDVRLAIRHPLALDTILAGKDADVELVGIGSSERSWNLCVRHVESGALLRLSDRSAIRAAERMRTDFVANASHELRTPLATIIGYAETLAEESPLDEEVRTRFGSTIVVEARRMLRIVEDLMSLSRIEADRFRQPDEQVDPGEVARAALEHASKLADLRGCRVESHVEAELPIIRGDPAQLTQLLDNLLGNAIRYGCTVPGSVASLNVYRQGERLLLVVSDQGEGISPKHLPRVTERFYRVDPARSRQSGGTGLGLAIVKHIVERHRGTLAIDSTPGHGTTVTVNLPVD